MLCAVPVKRTWQSDLRWVRRTIVARLSSALDKSENQLNKTLLLLCCPFALIIALAHAQSAAQIEQLKNSFAEKGEFDFQRATSEGKFRGCELNYRKLFRDFRANKGDLVATYGSINSNYFEGKAFNISFKLRTAVINPLTGELRRFQPGYASLAIGKSLEPFKNVEFRCEGDGICKGYADNAKFDLLRMTVDSWLSPGASITLTTAKGGTDITFALRELEPIEPQQKAAMVNSLLKFQDCLQEVMANMIAYLERGKK
jgi:hypothetical protein